MIIRIKAFFIPWVSIIRTYRVILTPPMTRAMEGHEVA